MRRCLLDLVRADLRGFAGYRSARSETLQRRRLAERERIAMAESGRCRRQLPSLSRSATAARCATRWLRCTAATPRSC